MERDLGLQVIPSDVKLTADPNSPSGTVRESVQAGSALEIVYSGRTDNQINLLYREYSKDDLARPAFFQNLTYSSSEKFLRFRNFRIEVYAATNEAIEFAVVED